MIEQIKTLREDAAKALQSAKDLTEKGDIDAAKKALQEHNDKTAEGTALQEHVDQLATVEKASKDAEDAMRNKAPRLAAVGADAKPGVATQGDPQPQPGEVVPKGLNASGRPADWIEGLAASAQPKATLARASLAVQEQAEVQFHAFVNCLRNGLPDPRTAGAMLENPDERRALQDLTTTSAYTVPTALIPTPIDQMGAPGRLQALCETRQVAEIQGSAAAFGSVTATGYAESGGPTEQTPTNMEVSYKLFPLGAFADITNLVLAGSTFDLIAAFTASVSRAIGRAVDGYIVNGTGSSQFAGLLDGTVGIGTGATERQNVAANNAISVADVQGMASLLKEEYHDDATFVTNVTNMIAIRAGDFTTNKGSSETGLFGPTLGYPSVRSSSAGFQANGTAGNKLAIIGDFRNYVLFEQPGAPMLVSSASLLTAATVIDGVRIAARQYRDGRIARKESFKWLRAIA